jgi:hypothetical protein
LVSVPEILTGDPLLAAPPVNPGVITGNGQLYVVPAGTSPLVPFAGITLNALPLQTAVVISVMDEFGKMVNVNVKELPMQEPAVGVMM